MPRPVVLLLSLLLGSTALAEQAATPYYSIQIASTLSVDAAREALHEVADLADARIEERGRYFAVRVGTWPTLDQAREALPALRDRGFRDATIMRITRPVRWLETTAGQSDPGASAAPNGGTTPATDAPPAPVGPVTADPAPAPAPAPHAADSDPAAPPPLPRDLDIPPKEHDFRAAAHALDWQVRKLVRTEGLARRDGFTYALDVAWLMRYAVRRSDQAFYEQLRSAAEPLVLSEAQDPFTRGFVLWRHRAGTAPEVTGAAEAMQMARALWEGAGEFGLERDRAAALQIIDGYAKHAFEIGDDWLVRKYYAFGSKVFASYSVIGSYLPDFLAEVEASRRPEEPGPTLAERSYGIIERAVHPKTGLMYPIVQPEINQTYPGMDLEVYAPNNVLPAADSCDAAESVVKRRPEIAEEFLEFFHDEDRRDRTGYPYAYFNGATGDRMRRHVVATPTLACLMRLAVRLDDDDVREWLLPIIQLEIRTLAAVPIVQEAPLYAAGPLLVAADALGWFRRQK